MTPTASLTANDPNRAFGAVMSFGFDGQSFGFDGQSFGFDGQYWYWFSAGVPAAGS
ncbi:hypothetical protein HOP54_16150 [Halomonas daqingensis]|uniref:hypothetical protein n=1 Tax=Billgrantia desiderata TaxID=52021 RepID=UPI00159460F1|nr:hypothetical protein [Halomonas desiderata]MCE8011085.1 hypothetical protein [Halomonas desiderata]MCE8030218.1 hypothetical protein [Halomonas desiderata]